MAQLAHVAGPAVRQERGPGVGGQRAARRKEVLRERQDVVRPRAQPRQLHRRPVDVVFGAGHTPDGRLFQPGAEHHGELLLHSLLNGCAQVLVDQITERDRALGLRELELMALSTACSSGSRPARR